MTARSPLGLLLAALVLALGYSWVLVLFAVGAMLGIAVFAMVPLYLSAVPWILAETHDLAGSLATPRAKEGRLGAEPGTHVAPVARPETSPS